MDLRIDSNIEDADEDTSANPEHNICAFEIYRHSNAYPSWIQTFRSLNKLDLHGLPAVHQFGVKVLSRWTQLQCFVLPNARKLWFSGGALHNPPGSSCAKTLAKRRVSQGLEGCGSGSMSEWSGANICQWCLTDAGMDCIDGLSKSKSCRCCLWKKICSWPSLLDNNVPSGSLPLLVLCLALAALMFSFVLLLVLLLLAASVCKDAIHAGAAFAVFSASWLLEDWWPIKHWAVPWLVPEALGRLVPAPLSWWSWEQDEFDSKLKLSQALGM